jgi:phospholipid/cholesterol/gamma-HCH transport system ATP-binding protein
VAGKTTRRTRSARLRKEEELLSFRDVSAGYGAKAVIHSINFTLARGEIAGVVSLDGTGKSSLVKVAAGLLPPFEGQAFYRGHDIYGMSFTQDQVFRKRTAVVLEGGALLANRSILENVALPLRYHDGGTVDDVELNVRNWLSRVGFSEDLTAFPWQVSMRGRRLAAFARALIREPELVIVDRFFEGLDATDWKLLMGVAMNLNVEHGTAFLMVGRVSPTIFHIAERVLVLDGGTVEAFGYKQTLMKVPRIRTAFETGDEASEVSGERQLTGTQRVLLTDSNPFDNVSSSDMKPISSSDGHPVVVVQDDLRASASERLEKQSSASSSDSTSFDGDEEAEKTMTLPPDAAKKLIEDAKRRHDARIEEDARRTESGQHKKQEE